MEVSQSPQPADGDVNGNDDVKYVSGLSTVLVATIQEAKDRISQLEYMFCSQLYPHFQNTSKSLHTIRRASALEFQHKESQLNLQIKDLRLANELALQDNLKLSTRLSQLEDKLLLNAKQVDDGLQLHAKLIHLNEAKDSIISNKDKKHEERINSFLNKLHGFQETNNQLQKDLQEKDQELIKVQKLNQDLMTQIESQALKITTTQQTLTNLEMEKNQLVTELGNIGHTLNDLRNDLNRKTGELEQGNKMREQLVRQTNLNAHELTKKDQLLNAHDGEKKLLLSRISNLENKLDENVRGGVSGMSKRSDDLLHQIELKNAELTVERQKNRNVIGAYKKLKSQHNFLLSKLPLNKEDVLLDNNFEEEGHLLNHDNLPEIDRTPVSNVVAGELIKVKRESDSRESSNDDKGVRLNQSKSSPSPSSSKSLNAAQWTTNRKSGSSTGSKRPASGWRDTRSCQSPGGPDPHDDFLDTPYENIRGNLHKVRKDFIPEMPAQVSKDVVSGSDDETQDKQAEPSSKKQQLHASMPGPKGFKYVEPVRKKYERENLNGIECKQCKKFYDAVLPDAVGKDGEIDQRNFRCEHHDGVSRHRYKYVPPMTPEGFWNIGFDSEI